jgi:oligosaccharide repeat unit polymerase
MTAINPKIDYYGPEIPEQHEVQLGSVPRPRFQPFFFIPTLGLATLSWMAGGVPVLNDFSMLGVLLICVFNFLREMYYFRRDFGAGGMVLFGGTMIWFCHDYFVHWFGPNFGLTPAAARFTNSHETVAKGLTLVNIFLVFATMGLRIKWGKKIENLMCKVPEPADNTVMLIVILSFLIGISPYFFAQPENPFVAMFKDMYAMRGGQGTRWTIGRTGNLNYNWGAYVFHLTQAGQVASILGACYVFARPSNLVTKLVCLAIWAFHLGLAFGTGSRGPLVAQSLPVISIILWQAWIYHAHAWRAIITGLILLVVLLGFVQYQGTFRTLTDDERNMQDYSLFKAQGNMMFSEGLEAYEILPNAMEHPGNRFPGAKIIRPLPEIFYRFATGWIPRALWREKPNSFLELVGASPDFNFAAYYNKRITGGSAFNDASGQGEGGGTVAASIVGMGYIPYGIPGVIQYAVLFGWLCAIGERVLKRCGNRLMGLIFAMGFLTYLFRAFRDLTPHDLYPLVIGTVLVSILILILGSRPVEDFEGS